MEDYFQLSECVDWILQNQFKRVAIQLKQDDLKDSVNILKYLKTQSKKRAQDSGDPKTIDFYLSQPQTCCVDLIVTQHVTHIDAIIHFGQVCLSQPVIKNDQKDIPILFIFGNQIGKNPHFSKTIESLKSQIQSLVVDERLSRICLFYDATLVDYAIELERSIKDDDELARKLFVSKLDRASDTWSCTRDKMSHFSNAHEGKHKFGHYLMEKAISHYDCAIYLGSRLSIGMALDCPPKLLKIDCSGESISVERVNVTKLLNRRVALSTRLKDEEDLRIGVIVTNPLADIQAVMTRLNGYAKSRRHILYYISMIQTIDECKIGNFDLCDAFVVVNACTCSTVLESLVFNRPIISELEFKMACGFEVEYGRVIWPGSETHLSVDDAMNKRKVSDVSLSLIHKRNELLERCSQARANKWSGMDYRATAGVDGKDEEESVTIKQGLSGTASSYSSEPTQK